MALLMLPRVVLTHLKAGFRAALRPDPSDDRLVNAAGVADPSEAVQAVTDNGAGGMEIALRQGRDFGTAETLYAAQLQADGLPSGVVSTAATIGVLPGEPRPRMPPLRSPPR